jgi:hypothetical protein
VVHFLHHVRRSPLYLYSSRAVQSLFGRLKCPSVLFEPAIFLQHDMFSNAGRGRISLHPRHEVEYLVKRLSASRIVSALLDLYCKYHVSESDRLAGWNPIEVVAGLLDGTRDQREQVRKKIV